MMFLILGLNQNMDTCPQMLRDYNIKSYVFLILINNMDVLHSLERLASSLE